MRRPVFLCLMVASLGPACSATHGLALVDASMSDAPTSDAPTSDASATDASATDASAMDASATDASAMDASVSDGPRYPNDAGHCPMQGAFPRDAGVCVCQPEVPDVCADVCTNTQTDTDNCGGCAKKCPATSVCNGGQCSPSPIIVILAPQTAADGTAPNCGPLRLVAAGTTLYWTDTLAGTVNSFPTAGGATTVIASDQLAPTVLQVVGPNIFWLNSGAKTIMKAALPTGTPTPVVTAPVTETGIRGFAVSPDGLTVYFSSSKIDQTVRPQGTISKVAASGGTITVVGTEDHGIPAAVATDGISVAFTVDLSGDVHAILVADGTLAQCKLSPVDGGSEEIFVNCDRIAREQSSLFLDSIFATGGSAYFVDGGVLKAGLTVNNPADTFDDIVGSLGGGNFTAFTVDGTNAYLAETGTRNCMTRNASGTECMFYAPTFGILQKTPLIRDSTAVPLTRVVDSTDATNPLKITSVAVDATSVYYATGDCAILSVAK
jgi:hypothetical protein